MSIVLRPKNAGIEKMDSLGSIIEDGFGAGGRGKLGKGVIGTERPNKKF